MTEFRGRAAAEFLYGNGEAPEKKEEERMTDELTETYNPPYEELVRLRAEVKRLRRGLIEMANTPEPNMRYANVGERNGYLFCLGAFKRTASRLLLPPKEDKS